MYVCPHPTRPPGVPSLPSPLPSPTTSETVPSPTLLDRRLVRSASTRRPRSDLWSRRDPNEVGGGGGWSGEGSRRGGDSGRHRPRTGSLCLGSKEDSGTSGVSETVLQGGWVGDRTQGQLELVLARPGVKEVSGKRRVQGTRRENEP